MTVNLRLLTLEIVGMFVVFGLALFLAAGTVAWLSGWAFLVLFFGFHHRPKPMVAQPQPRIADGAHDGNRQTRSTCLGQSVFRGGGSVLSCLAGLDAARCRPFPLVTDAGLAPGGGSGPSAGFVLPLFPDISGKPVSVTRRPRPNRARANGDIHRAVSLCAPSDVWHGVILFIVGTTLLLGSWYGLLFGLILVVAIAFRAVQEERVLRAELPGYDAYMAQVKYRLIPYLW